MKKKKIYIILIALTAILLAAFYNGITVRKYKIEIDGMDGAAVNIAVIADLHNTSYGKNQKRLIAKMERQKPDLILIAGDLIDNFSQTSAAEELLAGISGMAPVYYVTGNHEFWTGKSEEIVELIESFGVTVLRNEIDNIKINGLEITLCGTDDPDIIYYSTDEKYKNMRSADELLEPFEGLDEKGVNILVAHRPEIIEDYLKYPFDLALSGHAHGGQVRIPLLLNGLYAPNQGWFPKYAGGKYVHVGLIHIVSRGLSKNPLMPRIFNPPELVMVKLVAG